MKKIVVKKEVVSILGGNEMNLARGGLLTEVQCLTPKCVPEPLDWTMVEPSEGAPCGVTQIHTCATGCVTCPETCGTKCC